MPTFTMDDDAPILVEFAYRPGLQETSLSAADLAERSARALDLIFRSFSLTRCQLASPERHTQMLGRPAVREYDVAVV